MLVHGDEKIGTLDALIVGAHPDDVEIGMGATIALLTRKGYAVGVVDLTRGEQASRGTPEERLEESRYAADVLGLRHRWNLGLPDGFLAATTEAKLALLEIIRKTRPDMVFTHHHNDPHPDHTTACRLVSGAAHNAGLGGMVSESGPFRPKYLFTFSLHHRVTPSFLVGVDPYWPVKQEAILCYQSQVSAHNPGEVRTYLSDKSFMESLSAHAHSLGTMVGAKYAEGFHSESHLVVEDPLAAFRSKQGRFL